MSIPPFPPCSLRKISMQGPKYQTDPLPTILEREICYFNNLLEF